MGYGNILLPLALASTDVASTEVAPSSTTTAQQTTVDDPSAKCREVAETVVNRGTEVATVCGINSAMISLADHSCMMDSDPCTDLRLKTQRAAANWCDMSDQGGVPKIGRFISIFCKKKSSHFC